MEEMGYAQGDAEEYAYHSNPEDTVSLIPFTSSKPLFVCMHLHHMDLLIAGALPNEVPSKVLRRPRDGTNMVQ